MLRHILCLYLYCVNVWDIHKKQRIYCRVCGYVSVVHVSCGAAVKASSLTRLKPLCLLRWGISNESSQEGHTLWAVTQHKSSLPSVQCCGYVTRAWALKCWNIRWVSQLRCLGFTPSVPLEECESAAKRLWRRARVFPWELKAAFILQKPLCKGIMWMLLIRGRFAALELRKSWPQLQIKHRESGLLQFIAPVT